MFLLSGQISFIDFKKNEDRSALLELQTHVKNYSLQLKSIK